MSFVPAWGLARPPHMRDSSKVSIQDRARGALASVGWGLLLSLAYGQSPLYTSNQNQYFLHGLAQIGRGLLAADWLANTTDPTPIFTWLVALTARFLPPAAFYLYFVLLFAVYLFSVRGVAAQLFDLGRPSARWLFLAGIFITHSAAVRVFLGFGLGGEWEYLFDGGLAGQRVLGTVLQPSSFGVFLILSVQQFLAGRPYRAVIAAALAAVFHPTYLLSAATLTLAYMVISFRSDRKAILIGVASLLLVLPILGYSITSFLPASSEAQNILVNFRVPAHAVVAEWLGTSSIASLSLVAVGLVMVRSTRLFLVMAISLLAIVILTAIQVLTGSHALALIFPWRLTTYLVPVAIAVVVGWSVAWIAQRTSARWTTPASVAIISLSVLSGAIWMAVQVSQQRQDPARLLFAHVESSKSSGQLYVVPDKLQDFRLATGAPILADFKSIPYRGGEVLNWHERVRLLQWFYRDQIDCGLMADFEEYGVTHFVLDSDQLGQSCAGWNQLYNDGHYAVYAIE